MLTHGSAEEIRETDYPQAWQSEGLTFPISYHFEPGAADDGLTIDVPVATLNRVAADDFSWNVPGLREELVTSLIRSLPKNLRVNFVPAPNKAREFLAAVPAGEEPLLDALERYFRSTTGVVVPREAWDWSKVPEHLRPTYRVVDDTGTEQGPRQGPRGAEGAAAAAVRAGDGRGRRRQRASPHRRDDLDLRHHRASPSPRPAPATRSAVTRHSSTRARRSGLQVFGSDDEAEARHRLGVRRLLLLDLDRLDQRGGPVKAVLDSLTNTEKLGLAGSPYPSVAELLEDAPGRRGAGRRRRPARGARPGGVRRAAGRRRPGPGGAAARRCWPT